MKSRESLVLLHTLFSSSPACPGPSLLVDPLTVKTRSHLCGSQFSQLHEVFPFPPPPHCDLETKLGGKGSKEALILEGAPFLPCRCGGTCRYMPQRMEHNRANRYLHTHVHSRFSTARCENSSHCQLMDEWMARVNTYDGLL